MGIKRFEDLVAWQEARKLTNDIYKLTEEPLFNKDFDLKHHIRRTAVSIMANIAEGFGRYSAKESRQFFVNARGSLAELQSHLYVALDRSYLAQTLFDKTYSQTILVNKLVNGLISSSLKLINA